MTDGVAPTDLFRPYTPGSCFKVTPQDQCQPFQKSSIFWSRWETSQRSLSVSVSKLMIGSQEWIGSFEVSYVLNKLLGIDSAIINIQNGDQVLSKLDEFKNHFEVYGTPIMIGLRGLYDRRWSSGLYYASCTNR
jgi:hypothetical protein